jgi:hypothetical protein
MSKSSKLSLCSGRLAVKRQMVIASAEISSTPLVVAVVAVTALAVACAMIVVMGVLWTSDSAARNGGATGVQATSEVRP